MNNIKLFVILAGFLFLSGFEYDPTKAAAPVYVNQSLVFYSLKPCVDLELWVDNQYIGVLYSLSKKPDSIGLVPYGAILMNMLADNKQHSAFSRINQGRWVFKSDIQYFSFDSATSFATRIQMLDN